MLFWYVHVIYFLGDYVNMTSDYKNTNTLKRDNKKVMLMPLNDEIKT